MGTADSMDVVPAALLERDGTPEPRSWSRVSAARKVTIAPCRSTGLFFFLHRPKFHGVPRGEAGSPGFAFPRGETRPLSHRLFRFEEESSGIKAPIAGTRGAIRPFGPGYTRLGPPPRRDFRGRRGHPKPNFENPSSSGHEGRSGRNPGYQGFRSPLAGAEISGPRRFRNFREKRSSRRNDTRAHARNLGQIAPLLKGSFSRRAIGERARIFLR